MSTTIDTLAHWLLNLGALIGLAAIAFAFITLFILVIDVTFDAFRPLVVSMWRKLFGQLNSDVNVAALESALYAVDKKLADALKKVDDVTYHNGKLIHDNHALHGELDRAREREKVYQKEFNELKTRELSLSNLFTSTKVTVTEKKPVKKSNPKKSPTKKPRKS